VRGATGEWDACCYGSKVVHRQWKNSRCMR
jgi:hypothetical protein